MAGAAKPTFEWRVKDATFVLPARYEPLRHIGSGSYGTVCSAVVKDGESQGRKRELKVAIKQIGIPAQTEIAEMRRLVREVLLLSHFDHCNIVRLYDIFELRAPFSTVSEIYLVTELLDYDLKELLRDKGPNGMGWDYVQFFAGQMFAGLRHLHRSNVLHRDLKPDNIVVNSACELKILDFGLARDQDCEGDMTTGQAVVTLWYRPPELMMESTRYTTHVDTWSAGCVVAELMLGSVLFKGQEKSNQRDAQMEQLREVTRRLAPSYDDIRQVGGESAQDWVERVAAPARTNQPFRAALRDMALRRRTDADEEDSMKNLDQCVDLICSLVEFVPSKRLSADGALDHPWLESEEVSIDDECTAPPNNEDLGEKDYTGLLSILRGTMDSFTVRLPDPDDEESEEG
eukprot:TRINITY_DN13445_c0_g1_i1.p1 TRINITY_DN13445_c0_g1~~TRINITY_DN13445_c0_g1_i1.p1  ORF type:complete len:429 (+),score=113.31 TRINITY_DN13445_c0_g1_i1:83-1288(+)